MKDTDNKNRLTEQKIIKPVDYLKTKVINVLFYAIAAFYAFMMADLLFRFNYIFDAERTITRSYNLIPFKSIMVFIGGGVFSSHDASNIFGNIVLFIPLGVYVRAIRKHSGFLKSLLTVIITVVAVEIIQFAFGLGAGDVDDIILNSFGGLIGIAAYSLIFKILKEEARTRTAVSIIAAIIGVPVIYLYFTTVFNHLRL